MCFNHGLSFAQLPDRQTGVVRKPNLRQKPELGLAVGMRHIDVQALFLPRKEEKPELAISNDCWSHAMDFSPAWR